ncbi:MAG: hypothetical protein KDB65_05810 [Calditrichaeota bacterium]|nr:hypothetical protein [Calditrichota bacterium]MCB9367735.1 hypothetical protein [Calditrichota bacterium]
MKLKLCILAALLMIAISGCGLVSGTAFVSQEVDGTISVDTTPASLRGGDGALDTPQMEGVVVDLTENGDWSDFTIEGVEDGCINMTAENHLNTPVSGEIWIVMDLDFDPMDNPDAVRNNPNAFKVFEGIALGPNETRHFLCSETITLLQNTDRLVEAIQAGEFQAYGLGNEDLYCFTLTGIIFGFHVTGSL